MEQIKQIIWTRSLNLDVIVEFPEYRSIKIGVDLQSIYGFGPLC
jgi:hypothetical protein